jgi:hypothetical protein
VYKSGGRGGVERDLHCASDSARFFGFVFLRGYTGTDNSIILFYFNYQANTVEAPARLTFITLTNLNLHVDRDLSRFWYNMCIYVLGIDSSYRGLEM